MSVLTLDFMSTDESEDEHCFVSHRYPIPWRSTEVRDYVQSLNRKPGRRRSTRASKMRNKRRVGEPSDRPEPPNVASQAPEWALSVMRPRRKH